ncbi:transmembrane and immunoglobulin domain-containing protein 1-like [Engraulis encrasicolus]|uniref:transmembrane and immunoglobulin domain-containing protein 1-like n=1 Tax=Engraulis encrasicolus TaxID=184585 RepID=UPI002FD46047
MKATLPCLLLLCSACQLDAGVSVVLTPLEPKVLLGDSVALTCSAEGGSSPEEEELEWHREGALVKLDDHNRYTPSRLCVQNVTRQDHLVTFTCHLKRNFTITTHVTVKVRFPPDLSGRETLLVEEGDDAVLICPVWAYPQVSVTWTKDDGPPAMVGNGFTLYQDSWEARLTLTRVQRDKHQACYTCVANSPEFGNRSKTIQLIIEDKKTPFPEGPVIAGCVVTLLTAALAFVSRWDKVKKCCK